MAATHRARRLTEAHASPRHLAEVLYRIRGLRMIGHVLHVGAHPDDEDAGLMAFVAPKFGARMVYWSATRGEAGQNRIGSHSGDAVGIYRTWESLAARAIDGGESWYGPFYDFGYGSSGPEAVAKSAIQKVGRIFITTTTANPLFRIRNEGEFVDRLRGPAENRRK